MGQYYKAVVETKDDINVFSPWDFGDGFKLMEHSYIGNDFVEHVSYMIYKNPSKVYWMGDYANYDDLFDREEVQSLYGIAWETENCQNDGSDLQALRVKNLFLCNHTKKLAIPMDIYYQLNLPDSYGWGVIHPLPLLTAVGNGRGGGDYHNGTNLDLVGSWAGDEISFEDDAPNDYKEFDIAFCEGEIR